jgi:thiamine-phosphate pyrophosphorylase
MIWYAITDRSLAPDRDLVLQASSLMRAGVDWLQVREKDLPDKTLLAALKILVPEARRFATTLLINGRPDLAVSAGASGVHLPSDGLPTAWVRRHFPPPFFIVRSCHTGAEVSRAAEGGADAVTLGPVFSTPSKAPFGPPLGLEAFREICSRSPLPALGLGGIDASGIAPVMAARASGVAAIRLFCTMKNPLDEFPALKRNTFDR